MLGSHTWWPGRSGRRPRRRRPGPGRSPKRVDGPADDLAGRRRLEVRIEAGQLVGAQRVPGDLRFSHRPLPSSWLGIGPSPITCRNAFRSPDPRLDARRNADQSIHDQIGHDLKRFRGHCRIHCNDTCSPIRRPRPAPGRPAQSGASVTALVRPFGHPLGHLDLLESHAIFIIREVAAESERPVLLFSGGKDSAVLLHLAAKAFAPGQDPLPRPPRRHRAQLPRGPRVPRRPGRRAEGARLLVAKVQDSIDQGRVADPGPVASRNRLQTTTLLDAINANTASTPPSAGPGATRTRPGPRSGCSPSATRSASGTPSGSAPSCGSSTRAACGRASTCAPSRSRTGPSSTSGSTSAVSASRCRRSTTPTSVGSSSATACCWPRASGSSPRATRPSKEPPCATAPWATPPAPGPCAPTRRHGRGHHPRGLGHPDLRAGGHPGRRPVLRDVHGGPQARGVLLKRCPRSPARRRPAARSSAPTPWTCCASPPSGRSTTGRAP